MRRATTSKRMEASDDYLKLVRRFPLRPLREPQEYERAVVIYRELADRAEAGRIGPGESDYLDMLVRMIREYDEQHSSLLTQRAAVGGRRLSPVEALKHLMREHGMNTMSLGKLVGGSGQASMILRGKRELSKANIRTLAEHFSVSPALFI